ncbi:MAG TPA: hypothetical protein GXZ59_04740 [Clostridiaceae bacterium]|nr:hypothetical protein [Clostridiaceae bacterium]
MDMKQSLIIVYGAVAILLVVAFFVGGFDLIGEALASALNTGLDSALMLIASFLVIGQLNVLITADVLERWLNKFKGWKAIVTSAIIGGLFPGGPYIYYPFILSFRDKNLPVYIFASFIFGKQVYDFARLPMEISLISPEIAIIRTIITFPIPIIIGFMGRRLIGTEKTLDQIYKGGEKK